MRQNMADMLSHLDPGYGFEKLDATGVQTGTVY